MKKFLILIICAALLLYGCSMGGKGEETTAPTENGTDDAAGGNSSGMSSGMSSDRLNANDIFTSRDLSGEYDGDEASAVELSGDSITITEGGVYILSGKIGNGSIIVEADKSEKVQLVLAGVDVKCEGSAALYVKSADKVFLTLAEGTVNKLVSKGTFSPDGDVNIDGTIFSREDITINGKGSLTVESTDHGIVSKDDLKVTGGNITVTAASHALSGKDSVAVADGELMLTAGSDGIHSSNDEDISRGNILLSGGSLTIVCDGDGVDGSGIVEIDGGSLDIVSGGGSANGEDHKDHRDGMIGGLGGFGGWGGDNSSNTDSVSQKGLKSDRSLIICGGDIKINSADDAIHSDGSVTFAGGEARISTGDDGIHADTDIVISGGTLTITESYEGIEGKTITVSGGEIDVTSFDDGFNASDGTGDVGGFGGGPGGFGGRPGGFGRNADSTAEGDGDGNGDVYLLISGGKVYVNASGDGLDSNGGLYVIGGETYVDGPTNNGNGALDYGTEATISGGTVVAVGASGMAENFGSSSTQGAIMYNTSVTGNIVLKNASGDVLASFSPSKSFNSVVSVVVSAPGIESGETYTLEVGGQSYTIKMDSIIYGSGGGPGGRR